MVVSPDDYQFCWNNTAMTVRYICGWWAVRTEGSDCLCISFMDILSNRKLEIGQDFLAANCLIFVLPVYKVSVAHIYRIVQSVQNCTPIAFEFHYIWCCYFCCFLTGHITLYTMTVVVQYHINGYCGYCYIFHQRIAYTQAWPSCQCVSVCLTHWGPIMLYEIVDLVQHWNGLLPGGNKP